MAFGAPDHTTKIELEYMRYKEVIIYSGLIAMPVWPVWHTIVDKDMIGNFGRIRVGSTDPFLYLRVTIDTFVCFDMHAANLLTIGCYGINSGFDKYGVTRYDEVGDHHDFFYDEHWGLWIKDHLTVELSYEIGHAGNGSYHLFYKERYE